MQYEYRGYKVSDGEQHQQGWAVRHASFGTLVLFRAASKSEAERWIDELIAERQSEFDWRIVSRVPHVEACHRSTDPSQTVLARLVEGWEGSGPSIFEWECGNKHGVADRIRRAQRAAEKAIHEQGL